MTLITGPAFQGKLEYSKKHWPESIEKYFDGEDCDYALAKGADVINNYHHLIRRLLDHSIDPVTYTDELIRINPGCVVIMNDIGSGVIPIEKKDRDRLVSLLRDGRVRKEDDEKKESEYKPE